MDNDDKELFKDTLNDLNTKEVLDFVIVVKFKDGTKRSVLSTNSTELYDWIKQDVEENRRIELEDKPVTITEL